MFDQSTYQCTGAVTPTAGDTPAPAVGTAGLTVELASTHDGWGYAHLYDAETSEELAAFAIPEALDPRYADGFGDLSIHEFATDPETNLAYASYYAGGLRVFRFSREQGLQEVGKFIDEDGSNFWGVEQFTDAAGRRLIAGSDRDFGLQILRFTGDDAAADAPPGGSGATGTTPPPPAPPPPPPPPAQTARTVLSSFFGFGSLRRLVFADRRASATIDVRGPGQATATLRASIGRGSVVIARASRTATAAGDLRLTFRLSQASEALLRRTLARRQTRRTSGVLRVVFKRTGATKRTRDKAVSIGLR